ncbi:MAG TPA: shikimate dehydrogenase [Streptosporangiaceae bacterium]|nr:shikimate dehydrogenase [Streptosporangiaceae bacterium]
MKAAVLGSPIAHSLSPALHLAAYQALGLAGWSYEVIECDAARLPAVLAGCDADWAGLSLTMPLKQAVLSLLDRAEPLVTEVGAANTVVFDAGLRHGHNTDVPGMIAALHEAGLAVPGAARARVAPVLILGAGATACSALAAARGLGVTEATVAVRDQRRVGPLLAAAGRLGMAVRLAPFEDPGEPAPGLLISTAPAGAADDYAQRIRRGALSPGWVLDVVYHPWPTPLAAAAEQAGVGVAGGFGLLLHQAARQVELMTGKPAPVEAMRAAGLADLATRG